MTPRVLVVGSINMDLIVRCHRLPQRGETMHGEAMQTAAGGKGANQSVACSRLGAATTMVGRVGEDDFGRKLRAGLQADGVDIDAVTVDREAESGTALILLEEDGQNRIIVIRGANARLDGDDISAARRLLRSADVVLMQLEVPLSVVAAVAAEARSLGVPSVLDAAPVSSEAAQAALPALVDVISPNQGEASALTGLPVRDLKDAGRAAQRLRDMGARDVVLKLGEHGSYWLGEAGEHHAPAFHIEPVDTTAAGDAFTGSLAISVAQGLPMPDALLRANAAGSLACLKLGAQPSMPTAAEVADFLNARSR